MYQCYTRTIQLIGLSVISLVLAVAGIVQSIQITSLQHRVDELQAIAHSPSECILTFEKPVAAATDDEWHMPLTGEELDLVERVVDAEAANQPYVGQMAVAQCILDRATRDGCSVTDIVLSPNQFAPPSKRDVTDSVKAAVRAVFHDGQRVSEEPIYFFYSTVGGFTSTMHESLTYVVTIDDHKFFN
jgi:hypothetical protein